MSTERRPHAHRRRRPLDASPTSCSTRTSIPARAEMQHIGSYELPSEAGVERVVELSRELLFPGYAGPDVPRSDRRELRALVQLRLEELREALHRQVYRATHHKRQQELGRQRARVRRVHARAPIRSPSDSSRTCPSCAPRCGSICAPRTRAIRRRPASTRSCSAIPARTRSRSTGSRTRCSARAPVIDPAHDDRARAPPDRDRHPPGRDDRRVVLHRSRHRRGDRRDHA